MIVRTLSVKLLIVLKRPLEEKQSVSLLSGPTKSLLSKLYLVVQILPADEDVWSHRVTYLASRLS